MEVEIKGWQTLNSATQTIHERLVDKIQKSVADTIKHITDGTLIQNLQAVGGFYDFTCTCGRPMSVNADDHEDKIKCRDCSMEWSIRISAIGNMPDPKNHPHQFTQNP